MLNPKRWLPILAFLLPLTLALNPKEGWGLEAGRHYAFTPNEAAWYLAAYYNLPLTSPTLKTRLWLIPEGGLLFPDNRPLTGYGRIQLAWEQSLGHLFLHLKLNLPLPNPPQHPAASLKIGIRIGTDR